MESKDLTHKFMEKALVYLESSEAFLKDNVPSYIEEVLSFKMITELMDCLWCIPLFLLTLAFYKLARQAYVKVKTLEDIDVIAYSLFGITSISIGFLTFLTSLQDVIQVYVAPKMYLIEYFRRML